MKPCMYLGRAVEDVLLYVEGRPGVLRTWVTTYLAGRRNPGSTDHALCHAVAAGLIESHLTPDGARLWLTRAGLGLLHSTDYTAAEVTA